MESVPGAAWQERGGEGYSKKLRTCLVVRQKKSALCSTWRRRNDVAKPYLPFPMVWMCLMKDIVLTSKPYKPGRHLYACRSKADADFEVWNKSVFCVFSCGGWTNWRGNISVMVTEVTDVCFVGCWSCIKKASKNSPVGNRQHVAVGLTGELLKQLSSLMSKGEMKKQEGILIFKNYSRED